MSSVFPGKMGFLVQCSCTMPKLPMRRGELPLECTKTQHLALSTDCERVEMARRECARHKYRAIDLALPIDAEAEGRGRSS